MKHVIAKLLVVVIGTSFLVGTVEASPTKTKSSSSKSSSKPKSDSRQKCKNACLSAYQHCPTSGTACVHQKQACDASCK